MDDKSTSKNNGHKKLDANIIDVTKFCVFNKVFCIKLT